MKERFTILFNIFFQPDFGSDKIFRDICLVALFSEFVKSMLKNVECNIWPKLIKRCFNDNSGNIEKHFIFRFSINFVSWWTCDKIRRLKLCSNSFAIYTSTAAIIILFWNCWFLFGGSRWNEVRCCCVFDAKISPSLWNYIMFNDFMLENIWDYVIWDLSANTTWGLTTETSRDIYAQVCWKNNMSK